MILNRLHRLPITDTLTTIHTHTTAHTLIPSHTVTHSYLNNQIRRNNYSDSELMYGSLSKPKTLEIGALAHDIWKIEMIEQITPKLKRLLFESIDLLVVTTGNSSGTAAYEI